MTENQEPGRGPGPGGQAKRRIADRILAAGLLAGGGSVAASLLDAKVLGWWLVGSAAVLIAVSTVIDYRGRSEADVEHDGLVD